MTLERALEILKVYGDHRWKCTITKKLSGCAGYRNEPYECDCGWRDILKFELGWGGEGS